MTLQLLGDTAMQIGDLEKADEYLAESLQLFNTVNNRPQAARTILIQGDVAAKRESTDDALRLQRAALVEFNETDDHQGIVSALEAIACTRARLRSNAGIFLSLISAAAELRRQTGLKIGPARRDVLAGFSEQAKSTLGDALASSAIESGKTLSLEEAVELALSD